MLEGEELRLSQEIAALRSTPAEGLDPQSSQKRMNELKRLNNALAQVERSLATAYR